ncbi:Hypothetical protein Minf_1342 [Methylacidiphilum infernorum V4]|uniref:Uncharacterized protein n=1 Tax=Methylacidiphilum infernorum (isolate V4) TaxID=481448 RepID=B3DVP3_METI4|nr:Hypothetical protein Minf_1342 [Methylacidiphilum infernorum V4]
MRSSYLRTFKIKTRKLPLFDIKRSSKMRDKLAERERKKRN